MTRYGNVAFVALANADTSTVAVHTDDPSPCATHDGTEIAPTVSDDAVPTGSNDN